jgi:hypothetical protein
VDERDPDPVNLCWTLLPGLDLVAMRVFGVVAVFYVVGDEEAVTAWKAGEAQRWRASTGLAFTFGEG